MSRTLPAGVMDAICDLERASFAAGKNGPATLNEGEATAERALESAILAFADAAREEALMREAVELRRLAEEVVRADRESVCVAGRRTLKLDLAIGDMSLALLRMDASRPEPVAEPATLTKADVRAALSHGLRDAADVQGALDATFGPEGKR